MKFSITNFLIRFGIIGLGLGLVYTVLANSSGVSGRAEANTPGCNCHGGSNNNTVLTASTSNNFTFDPGEEKTITINVENTTKAAAGINIQTKTAETGGTAIGNLTAGSGLRKTGDELVHSGPMIFSGISANFTFNWQAPNQPGQYYLLAVGNAVDNLGSTGGDEFNWMTPVVMTVKGIDLTSFDMNETICSGTNYEITWNQFGVEFVDIELSNNGGNSYDLILAEDVDASLGTWTWNIESSFPAGDQYRVRISDASNGSINDFSSGLNSIISGVEITDQPQNQELCTGSELQLSVTAEGNNLRYQWKKDNNNIPNATNNVLNINSVTSGDAGNYTCEIISDCGNTLSDVAVVSIIQGPQILSLSQDRSICVGAAATLEVDASGSGLTYQWLKDGNPISGETENILEIAIATVQTAGVYSVQITSDNCGSINSGNINITIDELPDFALRPVFDNDCEGSDVNIWIDTENENYSYQWKKGDVILDGETSKTLTIENYTDDDTGQYSCEVTNNCGTSESDPVNMILSPLPIILMSPESTTINQGQSLTLVASAEGNNLTYSWFKDNQALGLTGPELFILSAQPSNSGQYYCEVNNECGVVQTDQAVVNVVQLNDGPELTLSQTTIDFGDVELEELVNIEIEGFIRNTGDENLNVERIEIENTINGVFALQDISELRLVPDEEFDIFLDFRPIEEREYITNIIIETEHGDNRQVTLRGRGVLAGNVNRSISYSNIYPIPSSDKIRVVVDLIESGDYFVEIFNSNGELVKNYGRVITNGELNFEWNGVDDRGNKINSGIYFLKIYNEKRSSVKQLIIER